MENKEKPIKVNWFNKNFKKIVFSLAAVGAATGTTGLVVGTIGMSKTSNIKYFKQANGILVWGSSTIWVHNSKNSEDWYLYFSWKKQNPEDTKWDGTYPKSYFEN